MTLAAERADVAPRPRSLATLVELLRWRASLQPGRIGWMFLKDRDAGEVRASYADMDCRARAIAARLQALRPAGERALLVYEPSLEYIAAFFGCLYAGAVAIPAYPPRANRGLGRVQTMVADAQASLILGTSDVFEHLKSEAAGHLPLHDARWVATDLLPEGIETGWQEPSAEGGTLAFLQYTSGSTGHPKGVMLTHANVLHNLSVIDQLFEFNPDCVGVNWAPPYHDLGIIGTILGPLYAGFPSVLMAPRTFLQRPIRWLEAISRYHGTCCGGPTFGYDWCARRVAPEQLAALDLSSWDLSFVGAEPIRAEILVRFSRTFAPCGFRSESFYSCYGMAEATLMITGGWKAKPPNVRWFASAALERREVVERPAGEPGARPLVSCGRTHPDMTLAIVDPGGARLLPPRHIGEVWVAGPSIGQGYWGRPEETAETFRARAAGSNQPFLRTADLGFILGGELFVTGRIKDLIIIGGLNHYPQDIEATVANSHPAIWPGGCVAFSVDEDGQERLAVVAAVDSREARSVAGACVTAGSQEGPGLAAEIRRAIRRAVAEEHEIQVAKLVLVKPGSIPKTSSGKLQRSECRARFRAGALEEWEP